MVVAIETGAYLYPMVLMLCGCRLLSRFYSTVFPLQEGDVIVLESYARIKHLQTKTWLHLEKGMQFSGNWKD